MCASALAGRAVGREFLLLVYACVVVVVDVYLDFVSTAGYLLICSYVNSGMYVWECYGPKTFPVCVCVCV